jgi:RNA recognition motif-containing protein
MRVGNFSTSSADYRTYPLDASFSRLHNYSYQGITMQTGTIAATALTKKLLVGNLPESTRSAAIENLFTPVGKVLSVSLLAHGFAFVEMTSDDADRALAELKGCRVEGRAMSIDEAHPRSASRY